MMESLEIIAACTLELVDKLNEENPVGSIALRLANKRPHISLNFVLNAELITGIPFLLFFFFLVLRISCIILLWHSLGLPYNYYYVKVVT